MQSRITNDTYDRIAAEYASHDHNPLEREIALFVDLLEGNGTVIDVGCGPAQYSRVLETKGLQVISLDLSSGMLAQARCGGTRRLVRADMLRQPVRSASVDGCFASASLLHLRRADMPVALAELGRVMRRGGVLYLGLKEGEGEEWVANIGPGKRFFTYYSSHEIETLLAASGFQSVDGWTSPPAERQPHSWMNRFSINQG